MLVTGCWTDTQGLAMANSGKQQCCWQQGRQPAARIPGVTLLACRLPLAAAAPSAPGLHVLDQVNHTVAVAILVVIPRDELDKGLGKGDASLGIKDAAVGVPEEVS